MCLVWVDGSDDPCLGQDCEWLEDQEEGKDTRAALLNFGSRATKLGALHSFYSYLCMINVLKCNLKLSIDRVASDTTK